MNIKKYVFIATGTFVATVIVAVGITARFNLSNIIAAPYQFIEDFFINWSPALSAFGTIIVAILAFLAITGKDIYSRIHAYPTDKDERAYTFLNNGCTDTAFLRENGISIVYSQQGCNNPDLVEVRENVYLLKKE